MKKRDNRLKKNSGGFTLIELIITVAIIAIFSGVILSFIGTGSNTYRSTSSNAKVQMETQEVVDRMEDLIIDANRSVYYANGTGAAMGSAISDDIDGGASTGNKTFIVCNEYKNNDGKTSRYICDVIDWNKKEQKVYYSQREYDAASSKDDSGVQNADSEDEESENTESGLAALAEEGFSDNGTAEDSGSDISATVRNQKQTINQSVLATGIVDFHADVSKVVSDKIVRFQLSTISGTKEIKTLHSVSLRNPIKVLAPDDAFKKSDATDVGIKILNAPQTMKPGESVMLSWNLTGNGSIDQSSVVWSSDIMTRGWFSTQDPTNGKLTIDPNATPGSLTVTVTAMTTDGKMISDSVVINVVLEATPTPAPTVTPEPTDTPVPTVTPVPTATPTPEPNDEVEILFGNTTDTIVAGAEYHCGYYNPVAFCMQIPEEYKSWDYTITWNIIGATDTTLSHSTISSSTGDGDAVLDVGANEKGFILTAEGTMINPLTNGVRTCKGKSSIKVINSMVIDRELLPDNIANTRTYTLLSHVYYGYYDEVDGKHKTAEIEKSRLGKMQWEATGSASFSMAEYREGDQWTINEKVGDKITIKSKIQDIDGAMTGNKNGETITLSSSVTVKVVLLDYNAEIIGNDIVAVGEQPEYYLELKDKDGKAINRRVTWSVSEGIYLDKWNTGTGDNNKIKIGFYASEPSGTYTITATIHATANMEVWNDEKTITKTITISNVKLVINGPDTGVRNKSGSYSLQVFVGNQERTGLDVDWKTDRENTNKWGAYNTKSGKNNTKDMTYPQTADKTSDNKEQPWPDNWKIYARVTIDGKEYTASKVVTEKKLK